MEPLKPETKARILRERPEASPEDVEEYERLLAERFTEDPDLPRSPTVVQAAAKRQKRLEHLYEKLFGSSEQLLDSQDESFRQAAAYVLEKNAEQYRRLS